MEKRQYYTFASTMPIPWEDMTRANQFIKAMKDVKDFHAVHPEFPYIMLIFSSLEGALRGREVAKELGERVADNIMYARIEENTGTLVVDSPAWGKNAPPAQ